MAEGETLIFLLSCKFFILRPGLTLQPNYLMHVEDLVMSNGNYHNGCFFYGWLQATGSA